MPGHPLIRYRVALLSAVSAVPATGATQFRVDLVPYAGLYLPTAQPDRVAVPAAPPAAELVKGYDGGSGSASGTTIPH